MVKVGDVVRLTDIGWQWLNSCGSGATRWELYVVTEIDDTDTLEAVRLLDPQYRWDLYRDEVEPCDTNPET